MRPVSDDDDMFDTDKLETIANEAIAGELPCLTEDLGHEILGLVAVVNAPVKEFDTTMWGNVTIMDVEYEGDGLSPSTEKVTLVFGVLGGRMVRRVKIPAGLLFGLIDLLQTALPEDGV